MNTKILNTINACILCIRFPFLYPRNRWTGNHWDSWTIRKYLHGSPKNSYYSNGERIEAPATNGIWHKAYQYVPDPESEYHLDKLVVKSTFWMCWYHIVNFIGEWILPVFHCIPTYTELDAMEPGWRKAFGIQMCKEIRSQLIKDHYLFKYRITQIKEKWGYLHWYDACSSKAIQDIIQKYENISWNTCLMCGKPATKISAGWISPYCDDCYPTYTNGGSPMVYKRKINGKWEETEEYIKAWEEIDKQYAKNKEKI